MENKDNKAKITINIKGDVDDAFDIYEKIKKLLYDSDIYYFDLEIENKGTLKFGFRNKLDELKPIENEKI
jgi:citrate lyase gamma subunit